MAATQQGYGDGIEADLGAEGRRVEADLAQEGDDAGEPRQEPAQRHGHHDEPPRAHAGVAGGTGVGADGADLEPHRRLPDEPPEDGHEGIGDEHAQVQVPAEDDGQHCGTHIRGPVEGVARRTEDTDDQRSPGEQGDVVEHDGGDDLVRSGGRLEEPGDEPVEGAGSSTGYDGHRDCQVRRPAGHRGTGHRGCQSADDELPGGADVEEAGLEAEGHGESGQQERCRVGDRPGDGIERIA